MNRREVLKKTGWTIAGTAALPGLASLLESCGVSATSDYQPKHLTPDQFRTIERIADIILPGSETPGASDVGVAPFIDLVLSGYMHKEEMVNFMTGLEAFISNEKELNQKPFLELEAENQEAIISELDVNLEDANVPTFYYTLKELVMWGYYTSEQGIKMMDYQPVPGQFQGCITADENTKNLIGNR